jgi:hypothetical protein
MNRKIIGSLVLVSTLLLAGCSSSASTSSAASSTAAASSATPTATATPVSHQMTFGSPDTILQKVAAASSVFPETGDTFCTFDPSATEVYASRENGIQYCGRYTQDLTSIGDNGVYGWEVSVGNSKKGTLTFSDYIIGEAETNGDETYEIFITFNEDGTRTISFFDSSTQGNAKMIFDKDGKFVSSEAISTSNTLTYPAMSTAYYKLLSDKAAEILKKAGMTWSDIVDESALKYYATEYKGE